jgi:hypothetical protein
LDQPASFEATLPGDLERDFGVPPEGEQFLLALEEILEAPTAVTGRGEEQIQPVSVKELDGPIGRFGVTDRRVRELQRGRIPKKAISG